MWLRRGVLVGREGTGSTGSVFRLRVVVLLFIDDLRNEFVRPSSSDGSETDLCVDVNFIVSELSREFIFIDDGVAWR